MQHNHSITPLHFSVMYQSTLPSYITFIHVGTILVNHLSFLIYDNFISIQHIPTYIESTSISNHCNSITIPNHFNMYIIHTSHKSLHFHNHSHWITFNGHGKFMSFIIYNHYTFISHSHIILSLQLYIFQHV